MRREKVKMVIDAKYKVRLASYNTNPVLCEYCKTALKYTSRDHRFCNKTCAARSINPLVEWSCKSCYKIHSTVWKKVGSYCNNKCQGDHQYRQMIKDWDKKLPSKAAIKRFLSETYGEHCSVCQISEWNNMPLVLELEHKDGNSENNKKENLCLICPNCHSQTPTYKGKNRGNGRHLRRERYKDGKSF